MTTYNRFNVIYRLQKWLDSVPGQTFMNYAYSWGASIVILGALFKLTHLPGANFWLFLGMGTEVFVFFISGFDRPFDKTEEGYNLPIHVNTEDNDEEAENDTANASAAAVIGGGAGGGTIIIGGGGSCSGVAAVGDVSGVVANGEGAVVAGGGGIIGGVVGGVAPTINDEMEDAQNNYVEQLKKLTEVLAAVAEQSERLTRDSEEMENLNRTLTGISRVYEMQLKGASQQIGTIDQINEQSRRMAEQIAELNKIYTRMIEAMTVNMKAQQGV